MRCSDSRINAAANEFGAGSITFANSFGAEDMVLTDLILRAKLPIAIFTLETGRLHAETLGMLDRIRETYGYEVTPYKPDAAAVENYVALNGLNAFYDSVEMRKECCRIRKAAPLARAEVYAAAAAAIATAGSPISSVPTRCASASPTKCATWR